MDACQALLHLPQSLLLWRPRRPIFIGAYPVSLLWPLSRYLAINNRSGSILPRVNRYRPFLGSRTGSFMPCAIAILPLMSFSRGGGPSFYFKVDICVLVPSICLIRVHIQIQPKPHRPQKIMRGHPLLPLLAVHLPWVVRRLKARTTRAIRAIKALQVVRITKALRAARIVGAIRTIKVIGTTWLLCAARINRASRSARITRAISVIRTAMMFMATRINRTNRAAKAMRGLRAIAKLSRHRRLVPKNRPRRKHQNPKHKRQHTKQGRFLPHNLGNKR